MKPLLLTGATTDPHWPSLTVSWPVLAFDTPTLTLPRCLVPSPCRSVQIWPFLYILVGLGLNARSPERPDHPLTTSSPDFNSPWISYCWPVSPCRFICLSISPTRTPAQGGHGSCLSPPLLKSSRLIVLVIFIRLRFWINIYLLKTHMSSYCTHCFCLFFHLIVSVGRLSIPILWNTSVVPLNGSTIT